MSLEDEIKHNNAFIESTVKRLLGALGVDLDKRQGMKDTPKRFAIAMQACLTGPDEPLPALTSFEESGSNSSQLIFKGAIPFYSHCEHHLFPFFGLAHVGYLPGNGKVLGISKIVRVVHHFARTFSVQERITNQIADTFSGPIGARGVGVILQARHLCVEMRGVSVPGTITQTVALRGDVLKEPECRAEFMTLFQAVAASKL